MPAAQRGDATVPVTGDSLAGAPEGGGHAIVTGGTPQETPPQPDKAEGGPAQGKVRLFTQGGLASVQVDGVTITEEGADVDAQTAQRAHAAALTAGFKLREEKAADSGEQPST